MEPPEQAEHDSDVARAHDTFGDEAFAAWAEGRAMTMEQAIECALESDRT